MISKKILVLLLFFVPTLVSAEGSDHLFVSFDYKYANNSISNVTVEQRVIDPTTIINSGDYKLRLTKGGSLINEVSFNIPAQKEMGVLGPKGEHSWTTPDYYSKTVIMPLSLSAQADDLVIEIKRDSQTLFSKKLSEVHFEVLATKNNLISSNDPSVSLPPFPKDPRYPTSAISKSNLLIGIIILLVLVILWFWMKKKNKQADIPNPYPNQPTPPPNP